MAHPGRKTRRVGPQEGKDPESLGAFMLRYLEHLRVHNYSTSTVKARDGYLADFLAWCKERDLARPAEITRPILQRYQRHLFYYRKQNGSPLSFSSQRNRVRPLLGLFKWLTRENVLLYNPAGELEMPRAEQRLPKHVLTAKEVTAVLDQADPGEPLGLRDRAMMETLYSTGVRRAELARLKVFDVDLDRGTVMVRQGKGKKDRLIPIGERAGSWIQKYLETVRPSLAVEPDDGTLFLTQYGEAFGLDTLTTLVAGYVERAKLGKKGACHLFRHAMATLMLENGADIRFIQEMLGHVNPATTQIYTRVAIAKLKQIHTMTHPAARLERPGRSLLPDLEDKDEGEEQAGDETSQAELDEELAAEAAEDQVEPEGAGRKKESR